MAEAENGDAGPAAAMYETAISVDPKNKTAYERYFTVNRTAAPEEAIRKLEEYKKIDPSYQIEAKVADMYYKQNTIGGMKDAVEWYKKGDANNYDETNFTQWANANYILRNYDDAVNVAKRGLAKFNNSVYLSRAALYAAAEKGDFRMLSNMERTCSRTTRTHWHSTIITMASHSLASRTTRML